MKMIDFTSFPRRNKTYAGANGSKTKMQGKKQHMTVVQLLE